LSFEQVIAFLAYGIEFVWKGHGDVKESDNHGQTGRASWCYSVVWKSTIPAVDFFTF